MLEDERLVVIVEMATYNHEPYIARAIESVMMQKTSFKYMLLICEDSSTDNSQRICLEYKRQFPDKIELHLNTKNLGMSINSQKMHGLSFKSNAKYIAMCDGDDYWIDDRKLQKQIDFLEANHDFSICFHRVMELYSNALVEVEKMNVSPSPIVYSIEDLAKGNFMHTPSVVFRNGLINELPDWFDAAPIGDYVIHMLNARFGKIYYMPDAMAVYRRGVGVHSTLSTRTIFTNTITVLKLLLTVQFDSDVRSLLKQTLKSNENSLLKWRYKKIYALRNFVLNATGLRWLKRWLGNFLKTKLVV